jgi:hypothetical protein
VVTRIVAFLCILTGVGFLTYAFIVCLPMSLWFLAGFGMFAVAEYLGRRVPVGRESGDTGTPPGTPGTGERDWEPTMEVRVLDPDERPRG